MPTAQRFAVGHESVHVVQQVIEDRVGDHGLGDPGVLVLDRELSDDDRGAAIGAIIDHFEQVFARERIHRVQAPNIEHQHVGLGERHQAPLVRTNARAMRSSSSSRGTRA